MSEESITDIIADLRNDNIPRLSGEDMIRCLLHNTADRLDAAVKRIKKILSDARCDIAVLDQLEYAATGEVSAPGNAAAMREALEKIARWDHGIGADLSNIARAALAAPARNCDRFQTADEAVAAFADHLREWENAHGISEYPDHPVQVPAGAFAWLFSPAKGGEE